MDKLNDPIIGIDNPTPGKRMRFSRTSPSLHLVGIIVIFCLCFLGFLAIGWAGELRGYLPSRMAAARDLAFLIPILGVFIWLTRRQRYRGEMLMLTSAVFLFSVGLLVQYRLFSDPEYSAAPGQRTTARRAKTETTRLLNVRTGYDDEKKTFLFGDPRNVPELPALRDKRDRSFGFRDVLTSINTYIPLLAMAALMISFRAFRSDEVLLWLQRHAFLIGLATLIPFAVVVLLFSEEGKFLGRTTPWEGVKLLFLISFAGILADTYRKLRRTRWGLPPSRYLIGFSVLAAMPVLPFFVLSDFGQMLVFLGVYVMLYVVAVRKRAQLVYGLLLVAMMFGMFAAASSLKTGFGVPGRVYFRVYQWVHTWEPPPPETWWWKRDFDRYLTSMNLEGPPTDERELRRVNAEAWSDKVFQQSQGLFGINEGGVTGEGFGLGFPETVPISDSDFVYAAVAEETGIIGSMAVLMAIGAFMFGGITASVAAKDMFTKLVSAGVTAFVSFQAIVNMGGVLRLLPMTGITLPFVSHGGWSLISSFAMLGVLMAISHRNGQLSPTGDGVKSFVSVRQ